MGYPFKEIEKKWQKKWEDNKLHKTDFSKSDKKKYVLVMFSYPSGDKLHVGHWFNYGPTDTWARFKKLQGYEIFEPMGFDAFGLPAENYAIKTNGHPQDITEANISYIRQQLKAIGAMYDWDHELVTSRPEYYKWTQWVFLQLYKKGLAYRSKAPVNWCPSCNTSLANEQVVSGQCERCGTNVEQKNLTQWFFKITEYADRLLDNIPQLNWPEKTKTMQKHWIGKSKGAEIKFALEKNSNEIIRVFTTRPDTLYGVTYMVLSPEHPLVDKITTPEQKQTVAEYVEKVKFQSELERTALTKEKTGAFTGAYAINPVNQEKIPIWIADYVLMSYGTGAVMAVPAHDERDFEFATQFGLPIRKVILEHGTEENEPLKQAYTEAGQMMNSGPFNGMNSQEGIQKVIEYLEKNDWGHGTTQYRLRDWLVSRQRYWGAPIPIIHCSDCGLVPVPENQLPVELPYDVDFKPTGESPLKSNEKFLKTTCPQCGKEATREADTMDTFVCSSWYFLRYPNNKASDKPFDSQMVNRWLPVDMYVGGAEHATMHLLYARFINMVLKDAGHIDFEEPFASLVHQGIIKGPDGQKMSKSLGNVINPEEYLDKYGSDAFRTYLMFGFDYTLGGPWDDGGMQAVDRFLNRIWRVVENSKWAFTEKDSAEKALLKNEKTLLKTLHHTIKRATEDIERFSFNTSIARIMELVNELNRYLDNPREKLNASVLAHVIQKLIILIAPFAPHLGEELNEMIGNNSSVFKEKWPIHDESMLVEDEIELVVQINGKVRSRITVPNDADEDEIRRRAHEDEKIKTLLEGKTVIKSIIIPKRLVNIVIR